MASEASYPEEQSTKQNDSGVSWKQNEEYVVPKNRLGIVSVALMCTMFLAALDPTIVATALPTIVSHLQGGDHYSWVGSAYMLMSGVFGPLYGKLSDMFGRKLLFYSCIFTFLFGSALCGAAQTMNWLIASRALQGIGGGGVIQLSIIILSDIVPLEDRGRYSGLLGAAYGVASVAGPLLGGALAQHASWRWCFFINLPIGGIATTLLFFFLNVHPPQKRPLRDQIAELDFTGLFSLVAGIVFLLLGLNFGEESWLNPQPITLLVVGVILLVVGAVNETFTKRAAILPPRLFKTRTTGCLLAIGFLINLVFFSTVFYLPLFYQVLGASATGAGIKTLPHTLVSSTFSVISGIIVSKTGKNLPSIWFGSTLMTVGMGLLIMLDYDSSLAEQEVFPLIAAIGAGFLFQIPILELQATTPLKDMATATSGFMFLRALGGAVGVAIGEVIVAIVLPKKLAAIPNAADFDLGNSGSELTDSINQVYLIPDVTLRDAVLHAWARSIAVIWMVMTVLSGVALVLTLFLREYAEEKAKRVGDGGVCSTGDARVGHAEDGHGIATDTASVTETVGP